MWTRYAFGYDSTKINLIFETATDTEIKIYEICVERQGGQTFGHVELSLNGHVLTKEDIHVRL